MQLDPKRIYKIKSSRFGYGALLAPYDLKIAMPDGGSVEVGRFSSSAIPSMTFYLSNSSATSVKVGAMCEIADSTILSGGEHRSESLFNLNLGGASSIFKEFMDGDDRSLCSNRPSKPIVIGDNVVASTGSMILGGANIGLGAVIAARAVVNGACDDLGVYGGIPARRLKDRFDTTEKMEIYRSIRIGDVHAHELPSLPSKLSALETGRLDRAAFKTSISYLPHRPTILVQGSVDNAGRLKLNKITGFAVGVSEVSGQKADRLHAYFSQFWSKPDEMEWGCDIFYTLGLY